MMIVMTVDLHHMKSAFSRAPQTVDHAVCRRVIPTVAFTLLLLEFFSTRYQYGNRTWTAPKMLNDQ